MEKENIQLNNWYNEKFQWELFKGYMPRFCDLTEIQKEKMKNTYSFKSYVLNKSVQEFKKQLKESFKWLF